MIMPLETGPARSCSEAGGTGTRPGELLVTLHATGLAACRRRDRWLAISVLVELMGGVDIQRGEVAAGFIRLYDYALREVRENRYEFAEQLMCELGEAYGKIVDRSSAAEATASD